jgi:hypothetical protein
MLEDDRRDFVSEFLDNKQKYRARLMVKLKEVNYE